MTGQVIPQSVHIRRLELAALHTALQNFIDTVLDALRDHQGIANRRWNLQRQGKTAGFALDGSIEASFERLRETLQLRIVASGASREIFGSVTIKFPQYTFSRSQLGLQTGPADSIPL